MAVDSELLEDLVKAAEGMARAGTRCDKSPRSHLVGLHPRGSIIWLRSLHLSA
jgi:hypothetical protein